MTERKGILMKSPISKNLRVSFAPKKHIKKIPHLNTMSEQEIERIWYSHYDYDDIKASFEYTVFMMDAGEASAVENDEQTTRGLEMRTEEGAWTRFEHKRDSYNVVLDEQDRQWDYGVEELDQLMIGKLCLEVTGRSAEEAYERGVQDQSAVQDYLRDTRELIRSLPR